MLGRQEVLHLEQRAPVDGERVLRPFRHVHHVLQDPRRVVDAPALRVDRAPREPGLRGRPACPGPSRAFALRVKRGSPNLSPFADGPFRRGLLPRQAGTSHQRSDRRPRLDG